MRRWVAVCLLFLALVASLSAQTLTPKQIFEKYADSVVVIEARGPSGNFSGTGFFYRQSDRILTCWHVIEEATSIKVKARDGSTWEPTSLSYSVAGDTAVLRLGTKTNRKPLPHGPSDSISIGDPISVIGNPEGLNFSLSTGVIAAKRRDGKLPVLQITAPISQGSSGSPVIDSKGRVIGMVSSFFTSGQNLNIAVAPQGLAWVFDDTSVFRIEDIYRQAESNTKDSGMDSKGGTRKEQEGDPEPGDRSEAITRLSKLLGAYYGRLEAARLRWLSAWVDGIDPDAPDPSAKLSERYKLFLRAGADEQALIEIHLAAEDAGKLKEYEGFIRKMIAIGEIASDLSEAELQVTKESIRGTKTAHETADRRWRAQTTRFYRSFMEVYDLITDEAWVDFEHLYEAFPDFVFGNSILEFHAYPDPDLSSGTYVGTVMPASPLKTGDVVVGAKSESSTEFTPIKTWKELLEYKAAKGVKRGGNLTLRIQRNGKTIEVQSPSPGERNG